MQVSVETLEGLQRKMTVQLPAEKVNEIVDNKLRTIAKQVRLDGFRPGKVQLLLLACQQVFETGHKSDTFFVEPPWNDCKACLAQTERSKSLQIN